MATMNGPRFKLCRSLGLNVCGHPKAMKRSKPGMGRADKKLSTYGIQLLEKQRLRAYYGVLEKQFKRYIETAKKNRGQTGETLVVLLETRLDNMVYRMGAASSIRQARQMVVHGHVRLNAMKVDIPSHPVRVGDTISLSDKANGMSVFTENFDLSTLDAFPYIEKNTVTRSATLIRAPERHEIPIAINDQLIVEFYSK
ncbi:MAG TPA: 30S ribosomal protein S4 [Clostridiales bacterium UBA8960]|jgi:small subunit ribosomal protein S4|nr:30S ribosomal protein S4 [Clostridiales bacterium UBA8960]